VAAVILSVETSGQLIDSIEVPEQIDMSIIAAGTEARRGVSGIEGNFNFVAVG
jgi:hypothetical protein